MKNKLQNIVDILKEEHIQILNLLKYIQAMGFSTPAGKEQVFKAQELILAHVKKEDEMLYPILAVMAKQNHKQTVLIEDFISEMKEISKFIGLFFKKYSRIHDKIHSEEIKEFEQDIKKLILELVKRIKKEENILFKIFQ